MNEIVGFLKSLYNAERLLEMVRMLLASPLGVAGLAAIVFAETGLLVGFFLPGDSLLFSVGVASGAASISASLLALILMCAVILGDNVGYFLGYQTGPRIFSRPKSKLFKPEHLERTHEFYERHGPKALIYARFVPIVRTFTPFVAGVARMRYAKFLLYSLFGGVLWIAFMITLGYELGQIPIVRRNFEKVVIGVVVLSLVPVFIQARHRSAPSGKA
ncbi:MAG: VTT domain-containing protein [Terriglobia bacterium]